MDLKGSKTEKNLATAFAGESQARNKYTYFASKAKKDGYEQIAEIFTETANNEKEHAKLWYKLLAGGIGSTEENLLQRARIMSGLRCMHSLQRKLARKVLMISLTSSRLLVLSRKLTRSVIANFLRTLRKVSFFHATEI